MKVSLKPFQEDAVAQLVKALHRAARNVRIEPDDKWAITFASPTGSGKTVMATAAIEQILEGTDEHPAMPDAVFLWITDNPQLNEQTRQRMNQMSSRLDYFATVTVDEAFEREKFEGGKVYFLNTQKLGANSLLVRSGTDQRTHSIWQTVRNTVRDKPHRFFVVIDEAHRGMNQTTAKINEANSLIQRFILGNPEQNLPPIPLIIGVSATPERFQRLIGTGGGRLVQTVEVDPADIRESGLIKRSIGITHPTETQPGDMTLLTAAVRSWKDYGAAWRQYCAGEKIAPPVDPILVIQVQDGTSDRVTNTNLHDVLNSLLTDSPELRHPGRIVHAFDQSDKVEVKADGSDLVIPYRQPSQISGDENVRVVLFKTALSTGWDCPRAEVMMSFRTAADATYIAQLVGRMVRTPLARRVDSDEFLNTVALYLPHYNSAALNKVVEYLTKKDGESPITEVKINEPTIRAERAEGLDDVFAAMAQLPSYTVPRNTRGSEIRRVLKFGRRLMLDDFHGEAYDRAKQILLDVLDASYNRRKNDPDFVRMTQETEFLDVRLVSFLMGEGLDTEGAQEMRLPVSDENIDELWEAAGKKLFGTERLHVEWWRRRYAPESDKPTRKVVSRRVKLAFAALADDADIKRDLERAAEAQSRTWTTLYAQGINRLPDKNRQVYDEIHGLAQEPVETRLHLPDAIEAKKATQTWRGHLYRTDAGTFPAELNTWETPVLTAETKRGDFVGWFRNTPNKPYALAATYREGEKNPWKRVFPDFLMARRVAGHIVIDLIDPHGTHLDDAAPKLVGLADYAEKHGASFGRIEAIILDGDGAIRRLDLQNPAIREKAKEVKTPQDARKLFEVDAVTPPTA